MFNTSLCRFGEAAFCLSIIMQDRDSASSRRTRRKCRGSASIMTRASLGGSIAKRQCKACLSALEAMMNYLVLPTRCHARIYICDQRSPIEQRREGKINNPASPSKIAEVCISILYSICCAIIGSAVRPGMAELKSLRFSIPAQTNNTARLYFHTLVELPDVGSKTWGIRTFRRAIAAPCTHQCLRTEPTGSYRAN